MLSVECVRAGDVDQLPRPALTRARARRRGARRAHAHETNAAAEAERIRRHERSARSCLRLIAAAAVLGHHQPRVGGRHCRRSGHAQLSAVLIVPQQLDLAGACVRAQSRHDRYPNSSGHGSAYAQQLMAAADHDCPNCHTKRLGRDIAARLPRASGRSRAHSRNCLRKVTSRNVGAVSRTA